MDGRMMVNWGFSEHVPGWGDALAMVVVGVVLLFATLHLARVVGRQHD